MCIMRDNINNNQEQIAQALVEVSQNVYNF